MSEYTGIDNLEIMRHAVNYNRFLTDKVVDAAGNARRVLDFGAGAGTFALALRDRGFNVECIELDDGMRDRLTQNGFRCYRTLDDVPMESFEFIYSLNVIEHIDDDRTALRSLRHALMPSGRLFIYVPAFMCLYSSMDAKVGHFRRYTKRNLVNKAVAAGLRSLKSEYADCLGFFASIVYIALGRSRQGSVSQRELTTFDRWIFPISRALDALGIRFLIGKNVMAVFEPIYFTDERSKT